MNDNQRIQCNGIEQNKMRATITVVVSSELPQKSKVKNLGKLQII